MAKAAKLVSVRANGQTRAHSERQSGATRALPTAVGLPRQGGSFETCFGCPERLVCGTRGLPWHQMLMHQAQLGVVNPGFAKTTHRVLRLGMPHLSCSLSLIGGK